MTKLEIIYARQLAYIEFIKNWDDDEVRKGWNNICDLLDAALVKCVE